MGGWCGACYSNTKGRTNVSGHRHYRRPKLEVLCKMGLKKPAANGHAKSGMPADSWAGSCLEIYATLMEFLSLSSWPDGSARVTGTLQISTGQGRWQGKLKDNENKRYCYLTGSTMEQLLTALEDALDQETADWRPDSDWPGKRAPGK
jgi:hypothetical protein